MQIDEMMKNYEENIIQLGTQVKTALAIAIKAFKDNDKTAALQVIERDEFVNAQNELINNQAVEILSLMQPVARDLRLVVGGIKIATDFERVGDYAKNIGRFVIKYYEGQSDYYEDIENLGEMLIKYFDRVLEILVNQDVKGAYYVASLDENIDHEFKKLLYKIADHANVERFPIELTNMLRNLERAGDHAKNICEQIVYIVNGQHVDFG